MHGLDDFLFKGTGIGRKVFSMMENFSQLERAGRARLSELITIEPLLLCFAALCTLAYHGTFLVTPQARNVYLKKNHCCMFILVHQDR